MSDNTSWSNADNCSSWIKLDFEGNFIYEGIGEVITSYCLGFKNSGDFIATFLGWELEKVTGWGFYLEGTNFWGYYLREPIDFWDFWFNGDDWMLPGFRSICFILVDFFLNIAVGSETPFIDLDDWLLGNITFLELLTGLYMLLLLGIETVSVDWSLSCNCWTPFLA